MKGQIEIDYMYKNMKNHVLLVKPSNMFRTPFTTDDKRIEEVINTKTSISEELKEVLTLIGSKGLNDILDSIIREKIDFFRTQTNCQVLFITMDKQQSTSSYLEQLDSVYLERPREKLQGKKFAIQEVKERKINKLLLALVTKYPIVEVDVEKKKFYLAISWIGKRIEEFKAGTLAKVTENNRREILTIDNL